MKRLVDSVSNSCKNLTSYVQDKVDQYQQRNSKKISKQDEFLADIDNLNRAIEMQERDKQAVMEHKMNASNVSEEHNSYVSMDDGKGGLEQQQKLDKQQSSEAAKGDNDDEIQEDKGFFWELVSFAKNRSWKKKLMTAIVMGISFYVVIDLLFLGNIMNLITKFLNWMTVRPAAAVGCFLGFFIFATLFFVPPTILYFGAGFAFADIAGFWGGLFAAIVVCFIGSSLGAILAFLRSRYMMRDLVELFSKRFPIVKCLDQAMKTDGFRVMALMRLCPIIPFNALNHVGGITQISIEEYTFALVGIIPNIVLWTLVGASAKNIGSTKTDDTGELVFYILMTIGGVIFAIVGLYFLYRYAREELHKEIKEQRAISWHSYSDKATSSDSTPDPDDDPIEQGFEAMERQPAGMIAVLGIDHHGVETQAPEDANDEDWMWVWA